ncbi:hypothetical protein K438DRAFT_1796063 [Mycena galopus ATCC 62051]|nr:hypothetical protein K438DRAFT_1796063 [Mycena galopus ATCC 62051]
MHGKKSWPRPAQADPSKSSAALKSTLVSPGPQTPNESTIPTVCGAAASDAAVAPDNVRPVVPTRFPAPWLPHWRPHTIQHRIDIPQHPVCVLLPAHAHGTEQRRRNDDPWVWGACMGVSVGVPWCGALPIALGVGVAGTGIDVVSTVLVIERPSLEPTPENSMFTIFANAVSTGLRHKPWRHRPWCRQRTRCPHALLLPGAIHPCMPCPSPRPNTWCFPLPTHAPPSLGPSSPH